MDVLPEIENLVISFLPEDDQISYNLSQSQVFLDNIKEYLKHHWFTDTLVYYFCRDGNIRCLEIACGVLEEKSTKTSHDKIQQAMIYALYNSIFILSTH